METIYDVWAVLVYALLTTQGIIITLSVITVYIIRPISLALHRRIHYAQETEPEGSTGDSTRSQAAANTFRRATTRVSEQTTNEMPALREGLVSPTDDDQQMPGKRRIYGDLSKL